MHYLPRESCLEVITGGQIFAAASQIQNFRVFQQYQHKAIFFYIKDKPNLAVTLIMLPTDEHQ